MNIWAHLIEQVLMARYIDFTPFGCFVGLFYSTTASNENRNISGHVIPQTASNENWNISGHVMPQTASMKTGIFLDMSFHGLRAMISILVCVTSIIFVCMYILYV